VCNNSISVILFSLIILLIVVVGTFIFSVMSPFIWSVACVELTDANCDAQNGNFLKSFF